jgi:biotin transport system substrate-specific component
MGVYARGTGPISLGTALSWCVIPYLIPDAAKIALASLLALRLRPIVQKH